MTITPEVRFAKSGDVSIAYVDVGDGPPLVFVPGFISHVELNWQVPFLGPLLERLAGVFRLVTFDKRGTGLSDRTIGFGTLEERMDDVRAVMDAAGLERASLFGISEGGPLSSFFAAEYPERVEKLALYATYGRLLEDDGYTGVPKEVAYAFVSLLEQEWNTGRAFAHFVQHPPDEEIARPMLARVERYTATPAMVAEVMTNNVEIDVRSVLPSLSMPTLVMHCTHDPVMPFTCGRYLADHIPGAKFVEIDGDFHASWRIEDQQKLVAPLEEFLVGRVVERAPIDRILTTVLFTDIVDSTRQATALGDADWRRVLDAHDAIVRDEIARFRGRAVNTTGDGFLASFDGPARAVQCAQHIVRRVRERGVEVRVGVHTGECEQRGDDLAGIAVHVGARIMALAGPGEVLTSRTVRDLVAGSGIDFTPRGEHQVKGVDEALTVYAAT